MTKITSIEGINVGDVVEYIGGGVGNEEGWSTRYFTIGKHYVVGGIYHGHKWSRLNDKPDIGVIADDLGGQNGHRYERFKKVSEAPSQSFDGFDQWWNKYYPQEYGHNSEFRDIVERHARRAFEAGRNTK